MSANPRILSIPPQPSGSTSHIHRYLETFVPHLPQLAQEGYEQFEYNYQYGSDPIHSFKQDDGSSSIPDRQALAEAAGAARVGRREEVAGGGRERRMTELGMDELEEYYGYSYDGQRAEHEVGGRREERSRSTPPSDKRYYPSDAKSKRELQRHASAPLRERSQNGRRRREGVEERAARKAEEARRQRQPGHKGSEEEVEETESAHRRSARRMRRRQKAAIRRPPPLLVPPSPPPPASRPRQGPLRSHLDTEDQSLSEASDPRPVKRSKAAHIGEEMMRNYRSGHVTTGRLTLRPGQTKGQGFLGKARSSGAIIGGRPATRDGQTSQHSTSSRANWAEKWRRPDAVIPPTNAEVANGHDRIVSDQAQRHQEPNQEVGQREMEIVRKCKIPAPGRTGSPSWPSNDGELHAQRQHPRGSVSLSEHPDKGNVGFEQAAPRASRLDLAASISKPMQGIRSTNQPGRFLKAAHPSGKIASPWQPRAPTGFGSWAHARPYSGIKAADALPAPPSSEQVLAAALAQQLHIPPNHPQAPAPTEKAPTGMTTCPSPSAVFGRATDAVFIFGNLPTPAMGQGGRPAAALSQAQLPEQEKPPWYPGGRAVPLIRLASPTTPRTVDPSATTAKPLIQLDTSRDLPPTGVAAVRSPRIARPRTKPEIPSDREAQPFFAAQPYGTTTHEAAASSPALFEQEHQTARLSCRHLPDMDNLQHTLPYEISDFGQQMVPDQVVACTLDSSPSFSVRDGLQRSADDTQNPFLSHPTRSGGFGHHQGYRGVGQTFSFPTAQSSSFSASHIYDCTPMQDPVPFIPCASRHHASQDMFSSRYGNTPMTPQPPIFSPSASSNPFAPSKHDTKPNTRPFAVPATPLAQQVEDDLQNFWTKRRSVR